MEAEMEEMNEEEMNEEEMDEEEMDEEGRRRKSPNRGRGSFEGGVDLGSDGGGVVVLGCLDQAVLNRRSPNRHETIAMVSDRCHLLT